MNNGKGKGIPGKVITVEALEDDNAIELKPVNGFKPAKAKEKETQDKKTDDERVGYFQLYRYAVCLDYVYLILGSMCAIGHGVAMPLMFVFFGDLIQNFVGFGKYAPCGFNYTLCLVQGVIESTTTEQEFILELANQVSSPDDLQDTIARLSLIFACTAAGIWFLGCFQVFFWVLQSTRQIKKIRILFFKSILNQDVGFFDVNSASELNTRLADDVSRIQAGMSDNVAMAMMNSTRFVAGLVIGMVNSWKLSLVILAVSPLLGLAGGILFKLVALFTTKELAAYAKAGRVAEEAISSIRTVAAFAGQQQEIERYSASLIDAKRIGIRKGFSQGASLGFLFLIIFSMYGLAFWYGFTLVDSGEITIDSLIISFFSVLIGAFSLGQAGSNIESFGSAKAAAYKIFQVIDRRPTIDNFSELGHKPDHVTGEITFRDVTFSYPSRPGVQVLKTVSLVAETGKTTALCGQSGCGKSTCVQLIQRFYDPQVGSVELDGVDIRTMNVRWLRQNIGVVAQEPVLFDTSIAENIRYGREGVTMREIEDAAKLSNAYDFIQLLPNKFDTMVGESGGQMSGGQKQRIAIARAIVRNPKIMLLDEATSALDTASEQIVQSALEKASLGRTTIVIAHRLSTIKNSDKIIGFHAGRVLESGSHDQLLKVENGVYQNLVQMQTTAKPDEGGTADNKKPSTNGFNSSVHRTQTRQERRRIHSDSENTSDVVSDVIVDEIEGDDEIDEVPFSRIMEMNKPEIGYIIVGCLAAGVTGGVQPCFAILFAGILNAFALPKGDQQTNEIVLYSLLFVAMGATVFVSNIVQATCFAKSGEELTLRVRTESFRAVLRQEIGYFDDHRNSTGAIATRLATDASKIQGATGVRVGTVCQSFLGLGVALTIGFIYSWRLSLLALAFIPFMIVGGIYHMRNISGQAGAEHKFFEDAGKIATEATLNIRTVAALTLESNFLDKYSQKLAGPYKNALKQALAYGFTFGYSQAIPFFTFAACYRFGAWLVAEGYIEFDSVFRVLMAIIFGTFSVGQASSFTPDYAQAKFAASRIFQLLDRKPVIDCYSEAGESILVDDLEESSNGQINYDRIKFHYPTRPEVEVLKGLTAEIQPGQTVALVGESGCGKSTCIQLLERFYDPVEGFVRLDGKDTRELNIGAVRSQLGIVSQEPVLFDRSIADNIRYGDLSRDVTSDEIVRVAKAANIHDFIESLSEGYETNVGSKGAQLSGGQKQRVAIARALLRNPTVLLLDEATSALDTESEQIVQHALDSARQGRTCIVIAHRLSTVKSADRIVVIGNGSVVESGTHDQLLERRAAYFSLVNAQLHHDE